MKKNYQESIMLYFYAIILTKYIFLLFSDQSNLTRAPQASYHPDRVSFAASGRSSGPEICSVCQKEFHSVNARQCLFLHMEKHFPPKFQCPVCGKKFHKKFNIKRHLQQIHSLQQCFHCLQTFPPNQAALHVCSSFK